MKILQLDGELDISQFELMSSILHNDGSIVLANNERIVMSQGLRFIWEVSVTVMLLGLQFLWVVKNSHAIP